MSAATILKGLQPSAYAHMVLFEQRQSDVDAGGPGYKASVLALKANLDTDIAGSVYGQPRKPAWFITQTSDRWLNDAAEPDTVPRAQLELALENDDMFLVGPQYRFNERSDGHPDANAQRAQGMMLAKVWFRCGSGVIIR